LRTSHPEDYDFGENELNSLGYHLLRENRVVAAVAVFRANTETHPQSANAFDSYGEALAVYGDTVQAIRSYELSFELNPNNKNALIMLQNLRKEN